MNERCLAQNISRGIPPHKMKARNTMIALVATGLLLGIAVHAQPGPTVTLIVRGSPGTGTNPRHVPIIVENRGTTSVSLRTNVTLQQQVNGRWQHASAAGLQLRTSCTSPQVPACINVTPSSTFAAAPWMGMFGDAQCMCTRCFDAPAGTYRFVVTTCDGRPIEGLPFVLPSR